MEIDKIFIEQFQLATISFISNKYKFNKHLNKSYKHLTPINIDQKSRKIYKSFV